MAVVQGTFNGRTQYSLQLTVTQGSQSVTNNTSVVSVSLRINESPNWGSWTNEDLTWSWNVAGQSRSGSTSYDFRNYDTLLLWSGSISVAHRADGTQSISFSASAGGGTIIGSASCSGSMSLTTIPRASQSTFAASGPKYPGVSYVINTNRASTGFTHTLQYNFGSSGWVTIATGVGGSTSWTPPMSLLNEFPSSPTGAGVIRTTTYSGGTNIGSKDSNFTLTVPDDVVPTWTSVSVSENNSAVASAVGAYVQSVSRLEYAINGAAGAYGSTISLRRFTAAGQTVDGATGVTPLPISSSGTVPVTWMIQDSRGKQKTQTQNITVLSYATPKINSATVVRALSDGTPDPDEGTYLRLSLNAVVQSLMNVTERNILQIKVRARLFGSATPWTDASTLKATVNPSGVTYNSNITVAGPFGVDDSYEIRIEVLDRFNTSAFQTSIAVGAVFMHWGDGLGVGKYHENGILDVNGDIYQKSKKVYSLQQTLYYTTSGTFTKATYPWLAQVRVRLVGGGGAGGGAFAGGSGHSSGGGGGGGGYAERVIPASDLASSVTVTVGAGGTGSSAASGGDGGASSFGTTVVATGGLGGGTFAANTLMIGALSGAGGEGTSGSFISAGNPGTMGSGNATLAHSGNGGGSMFGGGGQGSYTGAGGGSSDGVAGGRFGGGGAGARSNQSGAAQKGGDGYSGLVIVELFA